MRLASTDDVELAVHDLGGDGPPLLLAHATGFHGLVWEGLADALEDRFRLWSLDFRGHGDSTRPAPERGFDWHGFAEDVLAVVHGVGLERPVGVGHSKGGAALLLAELAAPGTFRAIYAYEPIVFPRSPGDPGTGEGNALAAAALRRREVFPSRDDAVVNFGAKPPLAELDRRSLQAYVDHGLAEQPDGTVRLKCRPADESAVYRMARDHGAFDRLGEVRCPVVVACGGRSTSVPPELARRQVAALPEGRLEVFDELGHFGPLEDPPKVAAAIATALGRP